MTFTRSDIHLGSATIQIVRYGLSRRSWRTVLSRTTALSLSQVKPIRVVDEYKVEILIRIQTTAAHQRPVVSVRLASQLQVSPAVGSNSVISVWTTVSLTQPSHRRGKGKRPERTILKLSSIVTTCRLCGDVGPDDQYLRGTLIWSIPMRRNFIVSEYPRNHKMQGCKTK